MESKREPEMAPELARIQAFLEPRKAPKPFGFLVFPLKMGPRRGPKIEPKVEPKMGPELGQIGSILVPKRAKIH